MNPQSIRAMLQHVAKLLTLTLALLSAGIASGQEPADYRILVPRSAFSGKNGCPDIVRLKDGRLFLAFREGHHHVNVPTPARNHVERYVYDFFRFKDGLVDRPRGSRIMGMWSEDEGKTWSSPVELVDNPGADGDCMLSVLKDGTVAMTLFHFTVHEAMGNHHPLPIIVTPLWRSGNIMEVLVHTSGDGGKTWSKPMKAPDFFEPWQFSTSPVVETDSGKWLMTFCGYSFSGSCGVIVESEDRGKNWSLRFIVDGEEDHNEAGMARLADGRIIACWRPSAHRIYGSSDDGRHWKQIAEATKSGKIEWPGLYQMSDGKVILFIGGGAPRLTWTPDLKTWHGPFDIDEQKGNAKVRGVELKDGSLLCVWHDESGQVSQHVCIAKVRLNETGVQVGPP